MHEQDAFGVTLTGPRFGRILGRMSTITTFSETDALVEGDQGMSAPLARRGLLAGGVTLLLVAGARLVGGAAKPTITVHKSPT